MDWKEQLQVAYDAQQRQQARATTKRRILPAGIATLQPGDAVYYVPRLVHRERYGQRATVVRAPRADVKAASVRVAFPDGHQQTVPARDVRRQAVALPEPTFLTDARTRPAWRRILHALAPHAQATLAAQRVHARLAELDGPALTPEILNARSALRFDLAPLERAQETALTDAQGRIRQLAGMVVPRGQAPADVDVPRVLLDAAVAEALALAQRQAQRGGRGQPPAIRFPEPADDLAEVRLDQEQRALVNRIAMSIHRRYLLSDRDVRQLTEREREQREIHGVLREIIGLGQREVGTPDSASRPGPRHGHELHGQAHDALTGQLPLALEACQWLLAGRPDHALTLARQVQRLQLQYTAARQHLDRHAVRQATGRYFRGDVLSVRTEHVELDEAGNVRASAGMTQYYARLIVLYGADGHTLEIANIRELHAVTGARATPQAWRSLCRWIEDHSDRAEGKKPGRRQDDDEHLIYRDVEGYLKIRASLEQYPDLLQAFEVIRRALFTTLEAQGITLGELGDAPAPGFHLPEERDAEDAVGA
ncbi:hypothetical protein [uncultured Deinococcus sp.]|uniref:hypothetical protein n=1 Tax=uncultured Deinococcus sp. TaxID=158789 RepID=UPI0025F0D122|nr:hypothetical protein [uncultured Deinococcus sp.]